MVSGTTWILGLGESSSRPWPLSRVNGPSGSLVDRVNFAAEHIGDLSNPGVRDMVDRIVEECGGAPTPGELVDACLDTVGPLVVSDDTRTSLIEIASRDSRE